MLDNRSLIIGIPKLTGQEALVATKMLGIFGVAIRHDNRCFKQGPHSCILKHIWLQCGDDDDDCGDDCDSDGGAGARATVLLLLWCVLVLFVHVVCDCRMSAGDSRNIMYLFYYLFSIVTSLLSLPSSLSEHITVSQCRLVYMCLVSHIYFSIQS